MTKAYALLLTIALSPIAQAVELNCTRTTAGDIMEEATLAVTVTPKQIKYQVHVFSATATAVDAKFLRITKSGDYMYDGSDLTDLADQCDMGRVFVDANLLEGKTGNIAFKIRQLGDSEGSWWLGETYKCEPAN